MGGRLDATNCLEPILTITTEISRDHVEILGNTLVQIAREKAGIIKTDIPHLVGQIPKEAEVVIKETCKRNKSRMYKLAPSSIKSTNNLNEYSFHANGWKLNNLKQNLLGTHQIRNSALVLSGIKILRNKGYRISDQSIRDGLSKTFWPARFQIITAKNSPTVVLDVCHNTSGAEVFAKTFKTKFPGRTAYVLLGAVKRKEHAKIVAAIFDIASEFHVVPLNTSRTFDTDELCEIVAATGKPAYKSAKLSTAYKKIVKLSQPDDIIVIVGSHYLAGEYLKKYVW